MMKIAVMLAAQKWIEILDMILFLKKQNRYYIVSRVKNGCGMMAINQNEVEFALRLWQSLVPNGEWILPKVGKYIRTGETELTLIEMYSSTVSANERSLFDHHDFIAQLGNEIGWNVALGIEKAYNSDGDVLNIPKNMIGDVAVCSCSLVIRVEPANPWQVYQQVIDGKCPHCKEISFDRKWNNIHVVTDNTAIRLKQIREEEE